MQVPLTPQKKRVLFVSRYQAVGGRSGNDEYVVAVLQGLADFGFEVDYLWLGYPPTHLHWQRLSPKIARAQRHWMPYAWRLGPWITPRGVALSLWIFLKRLWNFSQRFAQGRRSSFLQGVGAWLKNRVTRCDTLHGREALPIQDDFTAFRRVLAFSRPEWVIANYYVMAPLFDAVNDPSIGKIILTHDARHGCIRREDELDCLRKADLLLAIQEDDKAELQRDLPGREVVSLPMPLLPSSRERRPQRGRVFFVGSANGTNIEGLGWLLNEVWPHVLVLFPEAMLHVCGTAGNSYPGPYPRVRILGLVDDLAREYDEASVAVVPLLGGTGLKIKLMTALQHGCPVVSTPPGLQGLGFAEHRCIVRADSAEEMAQAICRLLNDEAECRRMENEARLVIEEYFSPRTSIQPFLDWCERRANESVQIQKDRILRPTV